MRERLKKKRARGDSQDRLVRFLLEPRSYAHKPARVRMVQTHISRVFIAPPFVFKMKKPVNLGFLDFSTLKKRRYFCEREVELNRRLSPGIYLGVMPVFSHRKRLSFARSGRVAEYLVKMRHLSERHFLSHILQHRRLTSGDWNRIAVKLRQFYQTQAPSRKIAAWGRVAKLKISTDENFRQMRADIGHTLSRPAWEAIWEYTNAFYAAHANLFASRIHEGRILDCHGDLHLEHIHFTPRSLDIYDCVEFNDRLRYIDVANDIAFLAMDLDFVGKPELAAEFVRRMSRALRDPDLPFLLDFYKCYRACVRGKVAGLRSREPEIPRASREAAGTSARRHFRLALQYAAAGARPVALVVMGRIASGKSSLAEALAAELRWRLISSDRTRKQLARLPLHRRPGRVVRERLYAPAMSRRTYAAITRYAARNLRAGQSVILDATFARRSFRKRLIDAVGKVHADVCFLELGVGAPIAMQRLRERNHSKGEISDARAEDFLSLNRAYEAPVEIPSHRILRLGSGGSAEATLREALIQLARRNAAGRRAARRRTKLE
jgi:hypothetical protein